MRASRFWLCAAALVAALALLLARREPAPPAPAPEAPTRAELERAPARLDDPAARLQEPAPVRVAQALPAPEPAGPRGRVLERDTGRPLAGLELRMRDAQRVLATARTDADGAFRFAPPPDERAWVELAAPGWRASPPRVPLTPRMAAGELELLLFAERGEARVRLRLVDEETGEPVPDFLVEVVQGGRGESVRSASDGGLVTTGAFRPGPITLRLLDAPVPGDSGRAYEDDRELERQHVLDGPVLDVPIELGPSWRLALVFPSGLNAADFVASLVPAADPRERAHHAREATDPSLWRERRSADPLGVPRALRAGPPPWVRAHHLLGAREHVLHVRSLDGRWAGAATVQGGPGLRPGLVPIELSACGSLRGRALAPDGDPVRHAWVRLRPVGEARGLERQLGVGRDGGFELDFLPEGTHELLVEAPPYEPWRGELLVERFATSELELRMVSSAALGAITGRLRSDSGAYTGRVSLRLQGIERPELRRSATPRWRLLDGAAVAAFGFDDLPVGRYELQLASSDGRAWSARRLVVTAPAEGLELVCRDEAPAYDLELRAVDAETGAAIDTFGAALWTGDPREELSLQAENALSHSYRSIPEGSRLTWIARASGYRLARGTERDVVGAGRERALVARLRRGWAGLYRAVDEHERPIQDVALLVDDVELGRTDERGIVAVELDRAPRSVELRHAGFQSARPWLGSEGWFELLGAVRHVTMRRE